MLERRLVVALAMHHRAEAVLGAHVPLPVLVSLEEVAGLVEFLPGSVVLFLRTCLFASGQVGVGSGDSRGGNRPTLPSRPRRDRSARASPGQKQARPPDPHPSARSAAAACGGRSRGHDDRIILAIDMPDVSPGALRAGPMLGS